MTFPKPSCLLLWSLLMAVLGTGTAFAQFAQAPVEARVPVAPQAIMGSDGLSHLAYELHISNFYESTGTLRLRRVAVFADGAATPAVSFTGIQVNGLLAHPVDSALAAGVPIEAGKRVVLFLWLNLPAGTPTPKTLRHQLEFVSVSGVRQLIDGVHTPVEAAPVVIIGAPLRSGTWLVHEGPGNWRSHHWGSLVAIGALTIPQRYAIDFFGLDATGHAVRAARDKLSQSTTASWVGFGAEVVAVADGVVRDLRDGLPNNKPLAPLPAPTDLTERSLMGNFVVLEIAPGVFVHYAHLQAGSLKVKTGDQVRRGAVLGQLGQSGSANAPHLHFQVTNAPTFEESEGLPFVMETFDWLGKAQIGAVLDRAAKVLLGTSSKPLHQQLPLDGDVVKFK